MALGYTHVEIAVVQTPKRTGEPCGDLVLQERTAQSTTIVCCDGIGSGLKANIAATMCATRIMELLRCGFSLRRAFAAAAETMNRSRDPELSYAAFALARILNNGQATVLTYDMPPPVFVGKIQTIVLPQRTTTIETALVGECHAHVEPGEGLLLVSDGITQAGLGAGLAEGWTIDGVRHYVDRCIADRMPLHEIPRAVHRQALDHWKKPGDDCTAVLASCRQGNVLNILTGPPADPNKDLQVVKRFWRSEGRKVICGATTTLVVGRCMNLKPRVEQNATSVLAPPRYELPGVDLVTEGAVTLNQVFNVLDEDPGNFEEESGVTELHGLLRAADRVNIMVGRASNPANQDIGFRQRGILSRTTIVPLIAAKLRHDGKLVVIDYV
ncbi:MAG: SpoIIE family protein phosphatase [Phycisphaerae bacterium]|nr:SpoIIE family protein phosphatase [Phycisphaerae bacterium]